MFSSINKTFGCYSKIFGCIDKKIFVVPNIDAVTKPFFFRVGTKKNPITSYIMSIESNPLTSRKNYRMQGAEINMNRVGVLLLGRIPSDHN